MNDYNVSLPGDEGRSVEDGELRPDLDMAIETVERIRPDGLVAFTAIFPDGGPTKTETFGPGERDAAREWAADRSREGMNIYFMVNQPRRRIQSKASKEDVEEFAWGHVDLDARPGVDPEKAKAAAIEALNDYHRPPTLTIDSGGGIQAFWQFKGRPLFIGGDRDAAEDAERYNLQIEEDFSGNPLFIADSCHNCDRIMRLPGTINLPNEKKRKAGRRPALAKVIEYDPERVYPLGDFKQAQPKKAAPAPGLGKVQLAGIPAPIDLETLPPAVTNRTRMLIVQGCDPDDALRYDSRSEVQFGVVCELVRAGCGDDMIAAVILDRGLGISEHTYAQRRPVEYAARQIERAREFAHDVDEHGRRILSFAAPFRTAQRLRAELFPHTIHTNGDWLEYRDGAYALVEAKTMQSKLYHILNDAVVLDEVKDNVPVFKPFNPDPTKVRKVIEGLEAVCHEEADAKAPPAWLGEEGPPPLEIISLRNGLLHLPTGELLPPTPDFFTRNALDLEYDPNAPEPVEWLAFLRSLWPDGPEPDVSQEMFGYLLLPDTSLQKIFLLVGPPRSGKGTILKVLTSLIGKPNVAAPSISELGKDFGLEPLIGKQLAAITDMRLGKKSDLGEIATNLLRISGEDDVSANRKGTSYWTGRLAVRFLILGNELPKFNENSPALARRFVPLMLNESFEGKEDRGLIDRLLPELPGILNWSIEGWKRLQERGHFLLPSASRAAVSAIQERSSPIAAFLAEMCDLGPGLSEPKDTLYSAWLGWNERNGERNPGGKGQLTRLLETAEGIKPGKPGTDDRVPSYMGVALKPGGYDRGEEHRYGGPGYQG